MKFFIDTADLTEIENAKNMGLIDGVTTNPSLIAKTGKPFLEVIQAITKIVDGPISAEVTTTNPEEMVTQGRKLAEIHPNIVVKLPLTMEGLKACQALSSNGIKTNVTLCFSSNQALLAAKAGATFVSPFIGRLDDIGQDGMQLISDIRTVFDNYEYNTEILAASIRHPIHLHQCALVGADVATIPFKVIQQLVKHPLTDAGQEQFLKDFEKVPT